MLDLAAIPPEQVRPLSRVEYDLLAADGMFKDEPSAADGTYALCEPRTLDAALAVEAFPDVVAQLSEVFRANA